MRGVFVKRVRKMSATTFYIFGFSRNLIDLGSGIMKLGSEGVYLHEKCSTNPSRHLPGPKNPVKKLKKPILGSRGFGGRVSGGSGV